MLGCCAWAGRVMVVSRFLWFQGLGLKSESCVGGWREMAMQDQVLLCERFTGLAVEQFGLCSGLCVKILKGWFWKGGLS